MNINQRIEKIMQYSELSPTEFAEAVDVQRSSISHITSGRNKPSLEFITKIKARFPEIEWDWLINGEGDMLKKSEEDKPQKPASLPDLFSLIEDDNFGKESTGDAPTTSPLTETASYKRTPEAGRTNEHMLSSVSAESTPHHPGGDADIIKIVWFYSNGEFKSFEPQRF
ncbi:helix-turn-helix transcriptional regulator [Cruoricaptor ignavus]|uniref:Helix-turn-helix transcriptional regulator n=1 Tax=Cruoricaptor ignavus TaxID=1118202 RepID=A0A7M1T597_9FLAO|nr:helix-turn-helix transcriptional regulator [Cruoricaptor ignavus]QOR74304.1 helix-turn-helix transcriptional regulator [Cruoricaptor ignavus]